MFNVTVHMTDADVRAWASAQPDSADRTKVLKLLAERDKLAAEIQDHLARASAVHPPLSVTCSAHGQCLPAPAEPVVGACRKARSQVHRQD
jgi:hypothetical protein